MPGCFAPRAGPVSGASADPAAAAAATARKDWREAADRWYAVYLLNRGQNVQAVLETSRALLMLEDAESANNMIDDGLRRHPEDVDLLEMKADILVVMGFRRSAENYYQRVLTIDPLRRSTLLSIGRARIQLGLESAAVAPLQSLVAATGGDYESYSLLARALKGSGDAAGAYLAWKNAFEHPGAALEDMLTASALSLDTNVRRAHPGAAAECSRWLDKVSRNGIAAPAPSSAEVVAAERE